MNIRPVFVGGPMHGKNLKEPFELGHPLFGSLPAAVQIPDEAGKKHSYVLSSDHMEMIYEGPSND